MVVEVAAGVEVFAKNQQVAIGSLAGEEILAGLARSD
jgi:hypothetical protein